MLHIMVIYPALFKGCHVKPCSRALTGTKKPLSPTGGSGFLLILAEEG
jgi:hypothetical protein